MRHMSLRFRSIGAIALGTALLMGATTNARANASGNSKIRSAPSRLILRFQFPLSPDARRRVSRAIDLPDAERARAFLIQARQSGRIAYIRDDTPYRVELVD
jgi:hypothetical protein